MSYNIIISKENSTVVSEYVPVKKGSENYQSEDALEKEFIRLLEEQGYTYITINSEEDLILNLRIQIEKLNKISFTDSEWGRFFKNNIACKNEGIIEKTNKIQIDYKQFFEFDNKITKNIYLINKKNIHENNLQVINQYKENNGERKTRYDVTILVNGLPLIHVELKRRGVDLREAFNQINRYQRDSFWAGSGLFEYVQIFVISNGTYTKYYSNTTRKSQVKESCNKVNTRKKSNSFEFTNFWADSKNKVIPDLVDFTKTFFAKHSILNILTKYCVFTSEKLLLVMRPYQIVATEKILNKIVIAYNYKKYGTIDAGGYIWHTTGSGKTLTSFKASQLAKNLDFIDKVLFVVDRKDLDYQTMKEYDHFQKGCANSNTSTKILTKQLEDENARIIITTIQKLNKFILSNKGHSVFNKNIVIIFDECHRSQFGDMHSTIIKNFKKYYLFGFTGTPIFAKNSQSGGKTLFKTTEQVFGEKLHTYTIVNAINDGNVLPFRIDFVSTVKENDLIKDKKIKAIDTEKILNDPIRVKKIVSYIIEHFDQKTKRESRAYSYNVLTNINQVVTAKDRNKVDEIKQSIKLKGFNSIFAVSSIAMAMEYYNEFKKQLLENGKNLKVATIFSFCPNEEEPGDVLPEENFDTTTLDQTARDFLDDAIKDYNKIFGTSFDTSAKKFENYYKDLSLRVKNREVDILIVVNMFLTGFDAKTLNTLWVDKNLKHHGLIQAFSRTNRILNSVKTFGNIVCFRNLEQETDDALALFGDKNASGTVLLKDFNSYYYGYEEKGKHQFGYLENIQNLQSNFPLGVQIIGEENKKDFIKLYGAILKQLNILSCFDDFNGKEILPVRDFQNYQSIYLEFYHEFKKNNDNNKEVINDDLVFEIELVKQVEVNIDYILLLVEKYHNSNCEDKNVLSLIDKAIGSSTKLRSKRELIEEFISKINANSNIDEDWNAFVLEKKNKELEEIINTKNLKEEETKKFIKYAFRDGILKTTGIEVDNILKPISRFSNVNRTEIKQNAIDRLSQFFEKYFGLV